MIALIVAALTAQTQAATCIAADAIHLADGDVRAGVVVIEDDRIIAIRDDPETVGGCDSLIRGSTLTAGLIESASQLGLVEVGMEGHTRDTDRGGDDPVRAAFQVTDSYNPRSTLIPIQRVEGLTSAVIAPSGGWVSGQGAWVDLAGASQAEAVVSHSVAMYAGVGRGDSARSGGLLDLRELLDDARDYGRRRGAYERDQTRDYAAGRLDLEALQPVVRGELPLVIAADRAADIEALIRFSEQEDIRLILRGGAEAWIHADALAAREIPVIVDPLRYGPGSFDQIHARADNPALLAAAGVPVIIATGSSHNARKLRQLAGNAVRGGMEHADALRAITSTPAAVFGAEDRGIVAVGAVANLALWSGDPLEIATDVQGLWIGGQAISLTSRQTELVERYRELPGSPVPALPIE